MVVPCIAMPVGGMDGEVDGDAVAFHQGCAKFAHRRDTLFVSELVRQRQDDVTARGARPARGFVLRAFGGVPQIRRGPWPIPARWRGSLSRCAEPRFAREVPHHAELINVEEISAGD